MSFLDVPRQSGQVIYAGPSTERKHQCSIESRDENLAMQGNHIDGDATNLLTDRESCRSEGGGAMRREKGG